MCRSIKTLFNFVPPATELEIRDASLQFIRKLSGFSVPSGANKVAFDQAVEEVAATARGRGFLCGITFELTGPRRQGALARAEKMYRVPQAGPRCPAGEGPVVERGVMPHRCATTSLAVGAPQKPPRLS